MPLPQIPKNRPVRLLRYGDIVRVTLRTFKGRNGVVTNNPTSLDDNIAVIIEGSTWIFHASSLEKLSTRYYYEQI